VSHNFLNQSHEILSHNLIMSHGYSGNRLVFGEDTLDFIRFALNRNYNVLTFDFRASGTSEGEYTTIGYNEKYDLLGAIDFAKANGANHIALFGFSMGGATSILAAAENPGIIDAVISDSSFHNLRSYLYSNLSAWSNLPTFPFSFFIVPISSFISSSDVSEVNPTKALNRIPPDKVMLIHSKNDSVVSYLEGEKLLRATNSSAVYWLILEENGPGHSQIFKKYSEEYTRRVFDFIDQKIIDTKTQRHLGIIEQEEDEMEPPISEPSEDPSLPVAPQTPEIPSGSTRNNLNNSRTPSTGPTPPTTPSTTPTTTPITPTAPTIAPTIAPTTPTITPPSPQTPAPAETLIPNTNTSSPTTSEEMIPDVPLPTSNNLESLQETSITSQLEEDFEF
jgi:uncharacterized protein